MNGHLLFVYFSHFIPCAQAAHTHTYIVCICIHQINEPNDPITVCFCLKKLHAIHQMKCWNERKEMEKMPHWKNRGKMILFSFQFAFNRSCLIEMATFKHILAHALYGIRSISNNTCMGVLVYMIFSVEHGALFCDSPEVLFWFCDILHIESASAKTEGSCSYIVCIITSCYVAKTSAAHHIIRN